MCERLFVEGVDITDSMNRRNVDVRDFVAGGWRLAAAHYRGWRDLQSDIPFCVAVRTGLFADAGRIFASARREIRAERDDCKVTMRKVAARNMKATRKAATARKTSVKAREPERDYSHRLLIDKLGVKPGQKIAVLGVESAEFLTELAARVPEYAAGKGMAGADLIFFSAEAGANRGQLRSLGGWIRKR